MRDAFVSTTTTRQGWALAAQVIEKNKVNPSIRDEHCFYPRFAMMLLRVVLRGCVRRGTNRMLIFTDDVTVKKKRDAVNKAIHVACRAKLHPGIRFGCYHHPSVTFGWK